MKLLVIGPSFAVNATDYLPQIVGDSSHQLTMKKFIAWGRGLDFWGALCRLEQGEDVAGEIGDAAKNYVKELGARPNLQAVLESEQWDYVTLQQNSHAARRLETFEPHAGELIAYIKKHAPQAEIVLHESWAYQLDGSECQTMYEELHENYQRIAENYQLRMIPAGTAIQAVRNHPDWRVVNFSEEERARCEAPDLPYTGKSLVNYWYWEEGALKKDALHLNDTGKFFIASLWHAFFTGDQARSVNFRPAGGSEEEAEFLLGVADQILEETRASRGE